nr:palmdelphin-like [Solea senegalensis]
MEEADLLKERLQAITDKRRIQEDIAKKRRQIEEEKLKLQYIKKKALREQWLMDGLSQQTEQEQEAMRLQAQDEQLQSDQLQSNIIRIEEKIQALEAQELSISANEEVVLKRLKEVERTTEDIIKELNAEYQADVENHVPSPLPDIPSLIPLRPVHTLPMCKPESEEKKKATFAIEINVEHDKRTGHSQVVSTATITPETMLGRGLKVFDDGRKSVYALHSDGGEMQSGAVGEMTPTQVEELLRQATENPAAELQYHQPVYSVAYTGSSRPSTPRTPHKTQRKTPTVSSTNGVQVLAEETQRRTDLNGQTTESQGEDFPPRVQKSGEESQRPYFHIPGQSKSDEHPERRPYSVTDMSSANSPALVSVTAWSEGRPRPELPVYRAVEDHSPSLAGLTCDSDPDTVIERSGDLNRYSPFYAESITSLNLVNTPPDEMESAPVTMIFMGYENVEDEEEEDVQAELIVIADSDDEDNENQREACLSYHPEGYMSQVFQPRMGVAKVTGCRGIIEDAYTYWDDVELHTPTFTHKPGKKDESANTGSINMEKMKR